jgi:hypothetical protein
VSPAGLIKAQLVIAEAKTDTLIVCLLDGCNSSPSRLGEEESDPDSRAAVRAFYFQLNLSLYFHNKAKEKGMKSISS